VPSFWNTVTRLGEAQILLPALLVVSGWLALRSAAPRTAAWWLALTALAALVTTATKVAFFGWGVGYAPLDFTGISGHAMFAAAVLPLLAHAAFADRAPRGRRAALAAAYALAALIALSRVATGAHSVSEVLLGFALGALASAAAVVLAAAPPSRAPRVLLVGLLAWMVATPAGAPPSPTHGWVISLSLALSGREAPFTREMMLQRWRAQRPGPSAPAE
jgi:membrane-associated phospholipid phosphatase